MWGSFKGRGAARKTNGFSSALENAVHEILLLRQAAGEIKEIKQQQAVVLQEGPRSVNIRWKIDFSFIDCKTDKLCYAEAKGFEEQVYKMKLKLYRKNPKGRLEIYKGTWRKPKLVEVIE